MKCYVKKWLFVLLLFVPLTACDYFKEIRLHFSQAEVQQWVAPAFPIRKREKFYEITLKDPQVILKEGSDRIGTQLKINASLLDQTLLNADVTVDGHLLYKPEKGALYLTDFVIRDLSVSHYFKQFETQPIKLEPLILLFLQEQFKKIPLYQLDESQFEISLAKALLKEVYVENGELVILLSL